ncbi:MULTISPECIES: LysR family transcriptional regulator [Ramlibacter]|uniref:LysR family transcriptional regulator n=1 Tax=Ramlibacter pinisoli TaxID=2682844 RepID=A0A6N8IQS8_9BURK|nr:MULTISPECIES: LysR family transcriptional regulator [Ramlibacter]MBA2963529.1 LysR family transcriptional regulator [Ramlibacter sp. CGMCC 1.13660]MVQ28496.1 LysR family transcriptional regulator [Ramlibacter pinisoli]
MDNIDIRLLRAFLVLMAEKNVSTAAEHLGISQPAASHALARLRVLFDDPLLLRSRAGMVPSTRAPDFEQGVRELLATYDGLLGLARPFDPAESTQSFVVSAPEYAERLLLPGLARRARQEAPHVRIEVQTPDRDRALELLETGRLDLRVAWLPRPPQSLRSMQLFQDRIVCIAAADHPTVRGSISLEQFLSLPHARPLGTGRTTTGRMIDEAVEQLGRQLNLAFLVQNFLTIPLMMVGTDLIATVPLRLATVLKKQHPLQILEPPLRLPRIRYAAYWHERSQKDPGHRWLRGLLLESARSLEPYTAKG